MEFLSLEPFIPSGKDFNASKNLFLELGFQINWDQGDYVGFQAGDCRFILQKYDNDDFAQNLMLSVKVSDVTAFRDSMIDKNLTEKYGVRVSNIIPQPYGKEVNLIDIAGVCWHFIES
jgi:hypothetical protein